MLVVVLTEIVLIMKYDIKWFHGLIAVSESVKTPLVGYEQSVAHKLKVITHTNGDHV